HVLAFTVRSPQAVVGGDVEDELAALHRALEGCGIGEVASSVFSFKRCDVCQVAGLADEQPQVSATSGQLLGDVRTDKAGRAGDEGFHFLSKMCPSGLTMNIRLALTATISAMGGFRVRTRNTSESSGTSESTWV